MSWRSESRGFPDSGRRPSAAVSIPVDRRTSGISELPPGLVACRGLRLFGGRVLLTPQDDTSDLRSGQSSTAFNVQRTYGSSTAQTSGTLSRCGIGRKRLHRSHARQRGKSLLPRLVGDSRRSLDFCRPAAISGAFEPISRLTLVTRRSLSFACAVVSARIIGATTKSMEKAPQTSCSRVAANGAAPPGAEPTAVTCAFRRAPGGVVRGQAPPR